jgi:GNAT superfamily N-acetyltransferase
MLIENIEIRPVAAAELSNLLAFFEGAAFADNPRWASCFCQFLHVDHRHVDWRRRTAEENRTAACARVMAGTMRGYLAFREGEPIGWCNAAPRTMLDAFLDLPDENAGTIGQITCFVIAKAHRRTGVATALLAAACRGLAQHGMAIAEAMPIPSATTDAEQHFGPLSMYLKAGFAVHRHDDDGKVWVRRSLRP